MLIKCRRLMEGPGPSEAIVEVLTAEGRKEEVVVDNSLLQNGYLNVGPILTTQEGSLLIELPREAASGRTRVWISKSELAKGAAELAM